MKKKQGQKNEKIRTFGIATLLIFGLGILLAIAGLSNMVGEVRDNLISKTPNALLASAGLDDGKEVSIAVSYFDQRADECVNLYDAASMNELKTRQFEWTSCGYYNKGLEQGLVEYYLDENYDLIGVGGELMSNRGLADLSRWSQSVEGKSQNYFGTLKMNYKASGAEFSYESDEFYPLDEVSFSSDDAVNKDGHNHLFTMNLVVPFTVLMSGDESFEITADDDTFVFIGNELALDMGGIHDALTGRVSISGSGEVYASVDGEEMAYSGINISENSGSTVRIFHSDRDSENSVFKMVFHEMDLNVMNTRMAGVDEGIQIAYDPTDPSFVAPLGETSVFYPDSTRGYMIMAMIFGIVVVVFSVLTVMTLRTTIKKKK
ncbi:fibro-slime domain-containing protein [Candidatus Saccharibacteria bacterium]|nr:fibro-slime domain-containing protein [Candidatus Saccharibacteria bacterium]